MTPALALLVGALIGVGACATYVHKTDTVEVPRKVLTQAMGRSIAIYDRVRAIENAACARKLVPVDRCKEQAELEAAIRRDRRELEALLAVPDYEVNWKAVLETLDRIGAILDKVPLP